MDVIIAGITRAYGRHCIGAFDIASGARLRLSPPPTGANGTYLNPEDQFWPIGHSFQLGSVWDITGYPATGTRPPHLEDYILTNHRFIKYQDLNSYMLKRQQRWHGSMQNAFERKLTMSNGKFYTLDTNPPSQSTGEWLSDRIFTLQSNSSGNRYVFTALARTCSVAYVGTQVPLATIPEGTLIRFSLAKPWKGTGMSEYRCYLQLSGVFVSN